MQYKFLNYKLNSFLKIISIILLLLLSFKINAINKVLDLNDLEEITISISPKYYSYKPFLEFNGAKINDSDSFINDDKQTEIKLYDYPILNMMTNENVDIELINPETNSKITFKISRGDIDPFLIDLTNFKSINKRDYFSYLFTSIKDNLTNIAFINCSKCNIDGDKVFFDKPGAQHTYQIHNIDKIFINGAPYQFNLKTNISDDFDYIINANIEILYGKDFNKKKLITINDIPNLGNGFFQFLLNTSELSTYNFFKISGIYFNLTNRYSSQGPVNIEYKELKITPSFSIADIDNTLFIISNSKLINLKYIAPDHNELNNVYNIKYLDSPVKVISDNNNYIEKYKIHHPSLIEHYRNYLFDIIYRNKIIEYKKKVKRSYFSGLSENIQLTFDSNYELSQNENFLNILSPTTSLFKEVKINTVNKDGLKESIVVQNYKTDSYIFLDSSKFITSIDIISTNDGSSTKVFDFEFISTNLLNYDNNILVDDPLPKFIIEKVNIVSSSASQKIMYFSPNQILPLFKKSIPISKIKESTLITYNFSCENDSHNINILPAVYIRDSTNGQIKNLFLPTSLNSNIKTKDIIDTIGKDEFYGLQFYVTNFSGNSFLAACTLKVDFINEFTEFKKSFAFNYDGKPKLVLKNWEDFIPGYYLMYDKNNMYEYPIMDFKKIDHHASIHKIYFQSIVAKFILILLLTGFLYTFKILINRHQKKVDMKNHYFMKKFSEIVNNDIAVMTILVMFSLLIYINEIKIVNINFSDYISLSFLLLYIIMFYNILINTSFIKSEIFKVTSLITLIILSYNISNDSYTYISILLFAYSFQIIKKLLSRFNYLPYKKRIDINIYTLLFIAFLSLIISLLVHFYLNVKFSDYFIVYAYYSAIIICIYKYFNSSK